jgi:BlaI family penicillinase repressor
MAGKKHPVPTERELEILRVLWDAGPASVRLVNDTLNRSRATGYTTTLKLMQIMFDKGLLDRNESERTHVYRAAIPKADMQNRLVARLLDKAFAGSAEALVMRALSATKVSAQELAKIRALLDRLEGGRSDDTGMGNR